VSQPYWKVPLMVGLSFDNAFAENIIVICLLDFFINFVICLLGVSVKVSCPEYKSVGKHS